MRFQLTTPRWRGPVATLITLLLWRRSIRDRKIHLAFEDIDARDENSQLIAHGKSAPGLPAN
jgi:hypothetical protein